jgi:1-deoxy-D-xylulose-5-phosphate synthase
MIDDALEHERVITIEDGTRHGGAGTLMVSALRNRAQELERPFPSTRILGVPRAYLEHDKPDALLAELGLDPEGLAAAFTRLLEDWPEFPRVLPEAPQARYP